MEIRRRTRIANIEFYEKTHSIIKGDKRYPQKNDTIILNSIKDSILLGGNIGYNQHVDESLKAFEI